MRIGIVALQGAVVPHRRALMELGHEAVDIRSPETLADVDGLVLPGGESTTQRLLIDAEGLAAVLATRIAEGLPVLATCAGLIVAVRLGFIDVTIERNGWGPQIESRQTRSDDDRLPVTLIRAPRIRDVGPGVEVMSRYRGEPIWVRSGAVHGTTFHPELTTDLRVHAAAFE